MELNVKLLSLGLDFYLSPKIIELKGAPLSIDQIEKLCSKLAGIYYTGVIPYFRDDCQYILVNAKYNFNGKKIVIDSWVIELIDKNATLKLNLINDKERELITKLLTRSFYADLNKTKLFWRISGSPRIFYEKKVFSSEGDINAYRRFELNDLIINGARLGYSVDIGTAFITKPSVEWYHKNNQINRFDQLRQRSNDRKGTLIYKGPNGFTSCYFEKYHPDLTQDSAPPLSIGKEKFESPYDYFQKKYTNFKVSKNDTPAKVSFKGMGSVYVPANRLYLRVFNDVLPRTLKNIDKIYPNERKTYLENNFWDKIGDNPFENSGLKISKNYFAPDRKDCGVMDLCDITFGKNKVLKAPSYKNKNTYREHFNNVDKYLEKYGCYFVPPILAGSKMYFVFPNNVPEDIRKKYVDDITEKIKNYLKVDFDIDSIELPGYEHYLEATECLKKEYDNGMVVFVFDSEDLTTYASIDYELKEWKLKRATVSELMRKHRTITEETSNQWDSYIKMTSLDIIQQMGCIPYLIDASMLNYDMQLFIDVSEDWTHFTLSLQIFKKGMRIPIFTCNTFRKTDSQLESINPKFLRDEIANLVRSHSEIITRYQISTSLVLRDGNNCKGEFKAIETIFDELKGDILPENFYFDFVEYHKTSRKGIRLWHPTSNGATNVLEGSYSITNNEMAVIATTGEGTLNQGTADPIIIVGGYSNGDFKKILNDIFLSSQFNFSSPRVAQRLMHITKRADDQLIEKRAQEIKLKN